MIKALIWNIRGVGASPSKDREKNLCRINDNQLLILLEPFVSACKLDSVGRVMGFDYAFGNCTNKILIFWKHFITFDILIDMPHVIHASVTINHISCFASFVYASCTRMGRKILWDQLYSFATTINAPWMVGGDFNSITNSSERIGGKPPNFLAMEDFNDMISNCNLHDIGFSGSCFTWNKGTMWQRLDRILFNDQWISAFYNAHTEHLIRTLSDQSPLLLNVLNNTNSSFQPFRFQNMWLLDDRFENIVKSNWEAPLFRDNNATGMVRLWLKLKRLKQPLRWWNKCIFKNVFTNIENAESNVANADLAYMHDASSTNLSNLNSAKHTLFNWQEKEEAFWRQKASAKFLVDGNRNTSYFHNIANHNKTSRTIHKLTTPDGNEIINPDLIASSCTKFFEKVFNIILIRT
ncbi:hypothetical protein MA16_Dca008580 [Dendrobium catenatum]|uniref:Endonuclease/exonuclease/phosphatase domain-containing protein n=1 Tax=Dendrobium catenatum TaxID=906689 RepID=A0A2I0WA40_9ASPA|nr:hypothetical protein MA16_Dca008580 [Dendrobium catenatum]